MSQLVSVDLEAPNSWWPEAHGRAERHLTGRWLGRYDYEGAQPVPFEVDLHDAGGSLTGDMRT
ncbi:MAG: hypothetical protein R3D56_03415 [Paracoccaceae bacterium]